MLVKTNGAQVFQVRYTNSAQGYTGKWQDIPIVKEIDAPSLIKTSSHV
jgi:hypothetical protein